MPNQYAQNAEYGGLVSGMANNHPEVYNNEGYNTFDRSSVFLQTQRFADINPIYSHKFISGDIAPIESAHELRTYTLSSPLLTPVYMHRSFYAVPLQAIYPHTFSAFFKPQLKGLDFPEDAKPKLMLQHYLSGSNSLLAYLGSTSGTGTNENPAFVMNCIFLLVQMFSKDGLLAKLGYGIKDLDVDILVQDMLENDYSLTFQVTRPSDNYSFTFNPGNQSNSLSRRRFYLYKLIQNKYRLTGITYSGSAWANFLTAIRQYRVFTDTYYFDATLDAINLEKVIAYQLVCAQFFTNSYVDDINTGKKWLDNQFALFNALTIRVSTSFSLNGVQYNYDLISKYMLKTLIDLTIGGAVYDLNNKQICLAILRNIFEIHESLKTSDYFVDSRTQPLAVGDVYASVVSNQVSAIDVNHSLWMQRLLNAVNRIPDNIVEYLRKMFGNDPISKEPQPMFISSERFRIGAQEVENTSATDQGNTVSLLRSNEGTRYRFEVRVSEPSVIIGLNSYSQDVVYASAIDKEFTEFDRYDNFNPYLQHIGDQPVTQQELSNDFKSSTHLNNFGYTLRYGSYKTSINHASGAFADFNNTAIASWASIYDRSNSANFKVINSEFIRNANIDFDDYYSSLTGASMTQYFHFICSFTTQCFVNSKQQKFPSLI